MNHASIAMNLYYQSKGRNHWNCDFRASGLIVMTDPSNWCSCAFLQDEVGNIEKLDSALAKCTS